MKQKQRLALLGTMAATLILVACDGNSANNGMEEDISSAEISSSDEQQSSSSGNVFSGSSAKLQSSSSIQQSSSTIKSSSSSHTVSSSSAVQSRFSSTGDCTNTYGTSSVTDCRDGQTYRTVTIGTQTWMAENLNYITDSSWCYNNTADSCAKNGRLYQWAAAMGLDPIYNEASAFNLGATLTLRQGACPIGWHVPTGAEWITLEIAVGGKDVAGTVLKSTSGWDDGGNGTDVYGFSAHSAGYRYYDNFGYDGEAYFWSASEFFDADQSDPNSFAYTMFLSANYAKASDFIPYGYDDGYNSKYDSYSVRCLKDI